MSTYPDDKRDRHRTHRGVPAMDWPTKRTSSYSADQRALAASLVPYVSDDDVELSRNEFLLTVADRIVSDVKAGDAS